VDKDHGTKDLGFSQIPCRLLAKANIIFHLFPTAEAVG